MSSLSRRELLENSMFAMAAAAAGGFVRPQSVVANMKANANSVLRVAVLGVNSRGKTHMGAYLKHPDCEIVAIVDPDEKVGMKNGVEYVEKKQGKRPAWYADMREVLDDPNIDIISVATPNHWHALATIWGVQAGKDVYVEKPVSHNVSEGRRAVQASRKYNKIVQCGTQSRSFKSQQDAIAYIHNGKIGEVKLARGLCYKPRKSIGQVARYEHPKHIDLNQWYGPAPVLPLTRSRFHYDWHWQWNCGNGDICNQGIHQMDIARWGLQVDTIGNSVSSYGQRFGYEDAGETANTQVSIHDFDDDKRIIFETRGLPTPELKGAKIGVIFEGSEGYLVSTSKYGALSAFDLEGKPLETFKGGDTYDHFANFIEAVQTRDQGHLNGDILEGHLSSALCHLGNISYRLGAASSEAEMKSMYSKDKAANDALTRTLAHLKENGVDLKETRFTQGPKLTLDAKKEVFHGQFADAANAMTTREYRKPFVVPAEADL